MAKMRNGNGVKVRDLGGGTFHLDNSQPSGMPRDVMIKEMTLMNDYMPDGMYLAPDVGEERSQKENAQKMRRNYSKNQRF